MSASIADKRVVFYYNETMETEHTKGHTIGSAILGINDGLIELTGALVGLSFAFKNNDLIALSGLVTGIAAALSMAASAYMQARHEQGKDAPKAALITGVCYIVVVFSLVAPYFIFSAVFVSMSAMLGVAFLIIAITARFNSIYLHEKYSKEFGLMFVMSMGVAAVSFAVGLALRSVIDVPIFP